MNLSAILHIPQSNYAYAYRRDILHIRLRTARDDIRQAVLVIARKHRFHEKSRIPMTRVAQDTLHDYYQCAFETDDPRLGYYFELTGGAEELIYAESGFSGVFDDRDAHFHYFQYPYIHEVDVHRVPSWVRDAVFYQIFVERFYNGDQSNDPEGISPWREPPQPYSFYGGDLRGILEKLDYVKSLGVNGIYLTPIFRSPSNHKYDTVDYKEIDPCFGDRDTLRELVEHAHARGIRVLLDGVFNHSSVWFAPFLDVLERGEESPYQDWFHIDSFPVRRFEREQYEDYRKAPAEEEINYRVFSAAASMPKLNTVNPDLERYLLDSVAGWMRDTGIDGWRLDVSDEVDHAFWRKFRRTVKEINPEALILGENWHNAYPWLQGDQFDGVMNYPVTRSCVRYFARGELTTARFAEDVSACMMWISRQAADAMLNLLDSHDTPRFLTQCGGDVRRFKLAVLFLFCFEGIPCLYYGDEIGMAGGGDPDCRRTFPWDEKEWNHGLLDFCRSVAFLRRDCAPLREGELMLRADGDVLVLTRSLEGESVTAAINNSSCEQQLVCSASAVSLLTTEGASIGNGLITLPPFSSALYAGGMDSCG